MQTFVHKSVEQIHAELKKIFPKKKRNKFTDFNSFFEQIKINVENQKLIMRPLSIIMLPDGKPDAQKKGVTAYQTIYLGPLENLSRNISLRLLYGNASASNNWLKSVKRQRVKVWTQDAVVMAKWKEKQIYQPNLAFNEKKRFINWITDNVNFNPKLKRVD